jgi:hypothetical protein
MSHSRSVMFGGAAGSGRSVAPPTTVAAGIAMAVSYTTSYALSRGEVPDFFPANV